MKPLYLNGREPIQVGLDGPALRVSVRGSAIQRFPLRRVSRVMASGSTSWSTAALLACADQGISVCFLDANGTARARWVGRPSDRDGLLQRWQDFQDRPDWMDLFRQWTRATRRRAIRMCAWRMGWSPKLDSRSVIQFIVQALEGNGSPRDLRSACRHLRGIAGARTLEVLAQRGLSAGNPSLACLTPTLVTVLTWALYPELTQWLRDTAQPTKQPNGDWASESASLVYFFERNLSTTDFYLNDALNRLQRFLIDNQ